MPDSPRRRPVVLGEEITAEIEELLAFGRKRGEEARRLRPPGRRSTAVHTVREDKPEITDLIRQEFMDLLEDEVVPARSAGPARGILDWELQREVAKKALVGLKLKTLQRLAQSMRLDKRGNLEDVAERIALAYRYDEREIAQLVLDNEDEPEPDRGYTDRLFPLVRPLELADVVQRLRYVVGRYVRVGVARWFVFDGVETKPGRLVLKGALRSYSAYVTTETDEHLDGTADPEEVHHLRSDSTEAEVTVTITEGAGTLRIRGKGAPAARAAAHALETVAGAELLGYVPMSNQAFEGPLGSFAPISVFMLDSIYNRLAKAHAFEPNLTVARFAVDRREADVSAEEGDRPRLKEVRFEGDYLLDSLAACQTIALEGRALIDLSLRVSFGSQEPEPARFPVRLSIERDHVLVLTGFGRNQPELSGDLQRNILRAVERSFVEGVDNVGRLEGLAMRIDTFARENVPVDEPTMLNDSEDVDA